MGKLLLHAMMTLDGFTAGPNGDTQWVFGTGGPSPTVDELLRSTGALLVGRGTVSLTKRLRRPSDGRSTPHVVDALGPRPPRRTEVADPEH